MLYTKYPALSPGGLTNLKTAIVSTKPLAALCVESGLVEFLRYDSPALAESITSYKATITKARNDEIEVANREEREPKEYWSTYPAPKVRWHAVL